MANGITTQGDINRLLQEGVDAVAQMEYDRYDPEYARFLSVRDSEKAYEIDVNMATYGAAQLKAEGAEAAQDNEQQLYTSAYVPAVYALRTEITAEAISDNLYYDEIEKSGRMLEESLQEAEEIVAADVINSGYTTFTIGDGQPVFSTAHVLKNGTFSNRFSAFTPLSEAALEDAYVAVSLFVDNAGKRIRPKVEGICLHPNNRFTAMRLLGSDYQPENSNNAINAVVQDNSYPMGWSENHYFTDTEQWFLKIKCEEGGKFYKRWGHTFKSDNSNATTMNYTHTGMTRFSTGVTDWRNYFGSGPSV